MEYIKAFILGIVQGLTEFLPISSTAHLRIVPAFFGWEDPGAGFSAVIQIGTMLAVIFYFAKDLYQIFSSVIMNLTKGKFITDEKSKLGWYIILGTIPISVFGLLFKDFIENEARSLYIITFSLMGFALLLAVAEKVSKMKSGMKELTFLKSQVVAFAQVCALMPGASRSGTTITGGLFVGLTREAAARFSFLLSVPAVLLSGLFQLYEISNHLSGENFIALIIATIFSFFSGYWAISFLLNFLKTRSTFVFIYYRLTLGILMLVLLWVGVLQP
ncbi:MAG: undecaprenyl-diphosphatase UppP [Bacteroidetes bacterium]|nr:undecaprenyl-diphosphatase UppP [Bacteroidota bacterium]MBU2585937.1 undecaprenyl-diphosphatase UppP [Bacteroidota bacterium]